MPANRGLAGSVTTGTPPMSSYRMISAAFDTVSVGETKNGFGVMMFRAFTGITSR
jgi:hypothetical protein